MSEDSNQPHNNDKWANVRGVITAKKLMVLAMVIFAVYFVFFDEHSLLKRYSYNRKIEVLIKEVDYYRNQAVENRQKMEELLSNPQDMEKFAREQYFMKRENEDIYIIKE